MAKMGFRKLNDMIGRCDLLEPAEPLNAKVKVRLILYTKVDPLNFLSLCTLFFSLWTFSNQSFVEEYAEKRDVFLCFLTLFVFTAVGLQSSANDW